jgi:hypothetical protein
MRCAALFLLSVALRCVRRRQSDDTSSTTGEPRTERFDDILNVRESKFQAFSVGANGTTSINLASLSPVNGAGVIDATMEIGWGKTIKADDGTVIGCDLAKVMQTTPALAAQMNDTLSPSATTARTSPTSAGLRESANFSIRITHP